LSYRQRPICAILLIFGALSAMVFCAPASGAASPGQRRNKAVKPDIVADFATLAQNRPRPCGNDEAPAAAPFNWRIESTECAWQNRLRVRRWLATARMLPGDCVSPQARWWAWARGGQSRPWDTSWNARSLTVHDGEEERIVLVQRVDGGEWLATEWRWRPSPRAATRRWQEGRWKLLAAAIDSVNQTTAPFPLTSESAVLQKVWSDNLANRAGEMAGNLWRWQAEGLCLRSDPVGPEQPRSHLPYSIDDTRLEQRAAMQLLLARRYPKASWLTPFRLVAAPDQATGGVQFYAVWVENGELKGQLWMPTKGDGPVVRLRIVASVPGSSPPAIARAGQIVERELTALARRWVIAHD
jgi:hypothetical protein